MLDLRRLQAIRLNPRPLFQRAVGWLFLGPNYSWPLSPTRITLEGEEQLPRGGAILVMNHTDRYNYWPFQYALWRRGLGYTATWVKGKYYENALLARFMDAGNNIPIPSKGYVISKDFLAHAGRLPEPAEYAALRRVADGKLGPGEEMPPAVAALLAGGPAGGFPAPDYLASLEGRFSAMMARVVEINQEALQMGLHLLIFPEGTRQLRLGRGHTGAAQIALYTGAPVVPIGCNGSDRCYPKDSPLSRGGAITYRVGAPLRPEAELRPFRDAVAGRPFVPFTASAEAHGATFRAMTDLMMDRINALLDPPYQRDPEASGPGGEGEGARRFL